MSMDGSSVHDEILYGSTFSPQEVTLQRYRFLDSALRLKKYSDSFSIVSGETSRCPYKCRIATVTMNTPFMGRPRKPSICVCGVTLLTRVNCEFVYWQ